MDNSVMMSDCDVLKETLEILKHFESDFISRIPEDFMNVMKTLASKSNIEVQVDTSKSLSEQSISEDCKDMISLIYYNYIATKDEKEELTKIWKDNENSYQKMLHEKYNPENIFNNGNQTSKDEHRMESMPAVIEEKSLFQKIISFIKGIFKNKN